MTYQERKQREKEERAAVRQLRRDFDRFMQRRALEKVRDDSRSTPAQILQAVKFIEKL